MRLLALVLVFFGFLAGPAAANMTGPSAECRAAQADMDAMLTAIRRSEDRIASLERFILAIPEPCADLKERAHAVLERLRNPQAAPPGPTRNMNPTYGSSPASFALPNFQWPPPTASARLVVPRDRLVASLPQRPSLYDVGRRLTDALGSAGYSEYSFFAAPKGFALTARLERIRDDGTPAPEEYRFLEPGAEEPFSLSSYVSRLFFAPQGFYRQIVFVVTDQPFVASAPAPTTTTAEAWLRHGANDLPQEYQQLPFGPGYGVTALVYEFRKGAADRDVATLTPGRIGGRAHLEKSGIYPALVTP